MLCYMLCFFNGLVVCGSFAFQTRCLCCSECCSGLGNYCTVGSTVLCKFGFGFDYYSTTVAPYILQYWLLWGFLLRTKRIYCIDSIESIQFEISYLLNSKNGRVWISPLEIVVYTVPVIRSQCSSKAMLMMMRITRFTVDWDWFGLIDLDLIVDLDWWFTATTTTTSYSISLNQPHHTSSHSDSPTSLRY